MMAMLLQCLALRKILRKHYSGALRWRNTLMTALMGLGWVVMLPGAETKFQGVWKSAEVNGHTLAYETGGSGPVVMLLHGGLSYGRATFAQQLDAWSSGRTLVLPDQAGHGRSADVAGPMTYGKMAEDTAALLKALDCGPADLVGWSDGGIVALMVAARYPELVRRVVVSGVNYLPLAADPRHGPALEQMSPEVLFGPEARVNFGQMSPDGEAHAVVVAAKLKELWLRSPRPEELSLEILGRIRAKVLVMAGDRDVVGLEETLAIFRAIPGAALWVLPQTEHATFATRAEWVNPKVREFLEGK